MIKISKNMPKHDCKSHRKLEKKTESTQITKKQLFIKKNILQKYYSHQETERKNQPLDKKSLSFFKRKDL